MSSSDGERSRDARQPPRLPDQDLSACLSDASDTARRVLRRHSAPRSTVREELLSA